MLNIFEHKTKRDAKKIFVLTVVGTIFLLICVGAMIVNSTGLPFAPHWQYQVIACLAGAVFGAFFAPARLRAFNARRAGNPVSKRANLISPIPFIIPILLLLYGLLVHSYALLTYARLAGFGILLTWSNLVLILWWFSLPD